MNDVSRSSNIKKVIFILLIILLSSRLVFLFTKRTAYHVDEVYNYGISNSLGNPIFVWIGEDGEESDYIDRNTYMGEWYDGELLWDYLTVDSEERFSFKEVIKNKSFDNAPANYELLVHLVCSFFPGKFSWAYAFSVNMLFYIGSLILVFIISKNIFSDKKSAIFNAYCCMIFWGLSICGSGAFTFLRMYGLLSFYSLLMIYSLIKILRNSKEKVSDYALLIFSFIMGIFTHTLFVIFAFWIILYTCLYYFHKRQIKKSIKIGLSILISLISFYIIYPFDYSKVNEWFGHKKSDSYSFFTKLSVVNKFTFTQSIGFYLPITYANLLIFSGCIFIFFVLLILINFLCRKENWFKSIKKKTYINSIKTVKYLKECILKLSPIIPIMFLASLCYMITTTLISPIMSQGIYATRYFLLCMNMIIICFISFILSLLSGFKGKKENILKSAAITIFAILLIYQNKITYNPFIFDYPYENEQLHDMIAGCDTAVFASQKWKLNTMIIPLRNTDHFYFDEISDGNMYKFNMPQSDFYMIIDKTVFSNNIENATVKYSEYIPGVNNSEEFISYILEENVDSCLIEYIDEFYINRLPYDVYFISIK